MAIMLVLFLCYKFLFIWLMLIKIFFGFWVLWLFCVLVFFSLVKCFMIIIYAMIIVENFYFLKCQNYVVFCM